jgi:hypothetical protein
MEEVLKAGGLEAMKALLESKHDILKTEALNAYAIFLPRKGNFLLPSFLPFFIK